MLAIGGIYWLLKPRLAGRRVGSDVQAWCARRSGKLSLRESGEIVGGGTVETVTICGGP